MVEERVAQAEAEESLEGKVQEKVGAEEEKDALEMKVQKVMKEMKAVSYTHLTLPTKA